LTQEALQGLRVLDLTRILAGPYCTMQLGDLGADIIKVEQPVAGDGTRQWGPPWAGEGEGRQAAYFLGVNRNKRSITLNLRHDKGVSILRQLAAKADVLIENFKVGTVARLNIDYDSLKRDNPALVYCSITGYGQTGPYAERPGYDFVIQAQGGIMSITGPVEGPPYKVGVAIADIVAGLHAAVAILAALSHRDKTGEGQYIDVALLDTQIAWLANVASNYLVSDQPTRRYGNAHPNIVPYEIFETSDGYIALGIGTDAQFHRFCKLAECENLWEDARFQTNPGRVEHRAVLVPLLRQVLRTRATDVWIEALIDDNIPAGPINTVEQVLHDPQTLARDMVQEVEHPSAGKLRMVGSPLKLSGTPAQLRMPPPQLGQHTDDILTGELGYTAEQVEALRVEGVI
jgi:formyl-CoA transferase